MVRSPGWRIYRFVWLVPQYKFTTSLAVTSFDLHIQGREVQGKADLAKGAGGDFRYIYPVRDHRQSAKIVDVKLLRSGNALNIYDIRKMTAGWGKGCASLLRHPRSHELH